MSTSQYTYQLYQKALGEGRFVEAQRIYRIYIRLVTGSF